MRLLGIGFALISLCACGTKHDPLIEVGALAQQKARCEVHQELPDECTPLSDKMVGAKIESLAAGHSPENIEAAIRIATEGVEGDPDQSPYNLVRNAFQKSGIPAEPNPLMFRLFSRHYRCGELQSLVSQLYQWVARGRQNDRLVFAFASADSTELALITGAAAMGNKELDSSPCLNLADYEDGFAFLTKDQIDKLQRFSGKIGGLEPDFRVFDTTRDATDFYNSSLVRHCLRVDPSRVDATVKIFKGGNEVENHTEVEPGDYSIRVTRPGFLPFSEIVTINKPTRVRASLIDGTTTVQCGNSAVSFESIRGGSAEGGCVFNVPVQQTQFDKSELSVTFANRSNDGLFALSYHIEFVDTDGIKRLEKDEMAVLGRVDSEFADGSVRSIQKDELPVDFLSNEGAIIAANNEGRFDLVPGFMRIMRGMPDVSGSYRIFVKTFHFLNSEATVPDMSQQTSISAFRLGASSLPATSGCKIDE